MIEHRPFSGLGRFDVDWLSARYHFSFADYHDPARMGWGPLRVWNDDRIRPGGGFPMHPHRDMEIITYVRSGAISHTDHLGNVGRTGAGDVQVMSAGRGILHSEYNLEEAATALFQIWIEPAENGIAPRWDTRRFPQPDRHGRLVPLASGRTGDEGALPIRQDAAILGATARAGEEIRHGLPSGRIGYLVATRGRLEVNGVTLETRDGAAIADEETLTIRALGDSEMVFADLPGTGPGD